MPIPNYRISSLETFDAVSKEPRQIAGLYFYQLLDILIEITHDVSADFRNRPQLYRQLGDDKTSLALARLNAKYGTDVDFLSTDQRTAVYLPVFGSWQKANARDSFPRLRDDLIRAARAFAERAVDTGVEMLREGVRTAHRPFKDYLLELHGDSIRFSKDSALRQMTELHCYPILRDRGVAAVFGIAKLRANEYPYATDPAEDLLIEQISQQLSSANSMQQRITRERISNFQRAALRGAEAIATAIDFEEADSKQTSADLDLLITKCYTWGTAFESLSEPLPINQVAQSTPGAAAAAANERARLAKSWR